MSLEKAKEYLKKWNLEDRVKEFSESSATVELAAKAIGCEPEHIAKTLSFQVEDNPVLIVASGDAKIDNVKFKEQFHTKAKMLSKELLSLKIVIFVIVNFFGIQVCIHSSVETKNFARCRRPTNRIAPSWS